MALTTFQRDVCRLIAANRVAGGESYVAGGAALNALLATARISRDIDLFHDTESALRASWDADRTLLESNGYAVEVIRERPSYVEAIAKRGDGSVLLQWTRDSAFRFFPLVEHEEMGLTLHPFDLATNKVLALVGRLEARDWIDTMACHDQLQRLGYLAWAACGKDPGFSPAAILAQARRSSRYTAEEVAALDFEGPPPDVASLSRRWREMLEEAAAIAAGLPPGEAGQCVIDRDGNLYAHGPESLESALRDRHIRFHPGSIRGAFPRIVDEPQR